ncbi:MAG: hypothetical protein ACJ790_01030 [Myxococcaceae bacterium]
MVPVVVIALVLTAAADAGSTDSANAPDASWANELEKVQAALVIATPDAGAPPLAYISRIPVKGKTVSTLQESIDATPDNSTLTLPSGVYGERIVIRKRKHLRIVAPNGPAYLFVRSGEKEPLIQLEDSQDITIENLWLNRDLRHPHEAFELTGLAAYTSPGLTLRHVYVDGHGGQAIILSGSNRVTLDDVLIENGAMGVVFGWSDSNSGPLAGDGLTISRSRISAIQVPLTVNTNVACDWMPPVDKPRPGLSVTGSVLKGPMWPSVCPQHVFGMKGNAIVVGIDGYDSFPTTLYQPHFDRDNAVVHMGKPLPDPKLGQGWRPPDGVLEKHLEEFAVLPPMDDEEPRPGGERWPICITEIDSRLFPDGPRLLDWWDRAENLPGCTPEQDATQVGAYLQVLEHRVGWIKVALAGRGPAQEVWLPLSKTFTPCSLREGKARLWLRSQAITTFEAIDAKTVVVIGKSDGCEGQKLKELVEVPASLRPATQRKFTAECSFRMDPAACRRLTQPTDLNELGTPLLGPLPPLPPQPPHSKGR